MRRWFLLLLLLFVGCQGSSPSMRAAVYQQANQAFARGNYEVSMRLCEHVLAEDPSHLGAQTLHEQARKKLQEQTSPWRQDRP